MAKPKWEEHAVHINAELNRLNEGQQEMAKTLFQNTLVLEKNTTLLEEHMRRTEAVERTLEEIRAENKRELKVVEDKLESEVSPIKTHIGALRLIAKIGAGLVALVGAGAALIKILEYING